MPHPEDSWICLRHRNGLQGGGFKFPPVSLAGQFAFEGRSWNGKGNEWAGVPTRWRDQFGFHSWLTPLPSQVDRPSVFHHSGDAGDVLYALAAVKSAGGGALFFSGDNKYPFPRPTRWQLDGAKPDWVNNLKPLLLAQDYVWSASYTHAIPFSTDVDFNRFRESTGPGARRTGAACSGCISRRRGWHGPRTSPGSRWTSRR